MAKTLDLVFKLDVFMNNGFAGKISAAGKAFQGLQERTQALQRTSANIGAYQRQEANIAGLASRLEAMQNNLASTTQRYETQRTVTRELNAQYTREREKLKIMSGTMPKSSAAYKEQAAKVRELALACKQSESASKKLEAEQQKLAQSVNRAEERLQSERSKLSEMQSALNNAGISTENLSGKQRELAQAIAKSEAAQSRYSALKDRVSWGNIKGAFAETAPIVGVIKPMVKLAGDFEAQMQRVKAVAFSTPEADLSQFEELKEYAAQLGAETQFTSIEAGQAMENLARAGMSAPDIIATMRPLLDMSAAEGMGISEASSILAGVQAGMNMSASESQRIADVLAYTSSSSKTSIATLGEAFKVAAPSASSLNVSIEQLASYLGVLGNKGFEGSEAGNALAASFSRLARRPKQAQDALNKLGVAVITRTGAMRELPDILQEISDKTAKMGEANRLAILGQIFGANYDKQMNALMSGVTAGQALRLETGAKNDAKGQSSKMANINLDSLNGQLTLLSSAWDGLKTSLGDMFLPHVRDAVELLSSAISRLTGFIKEFPNASKGAVMALTAIAAVPAAKSLFSIGSALIQLPGAFLQVVSAGRNAQNVIAGVAGTVNNAGGVFSVLGGVISKTWALIMANPFVAIGAAVVAAGTLIYQNWDAIKNFAGECASWIGDKWRSFANWWASWKITDVFAGLPDCARIACEAVLSWWKTLFSWFSSFNLPNIFAPLVNFAQNVIENVKAPFTALAEWITNLFSSLNPFNWEMPSWMGGGQTPQQTQQRHDRAMNALDMAFGAPAGLSQHATGGIFSTPHVALFAEKGTEAVIPLTDKSRGIPLLMESARIMGLQPVNNFLTQNSRMHEAHIRNMESVNTLGNVNYDDNLFSTITNSRDNSRTNNAVNYAPAINITVNSGNSENDDTLALKIADAVKNALAEIQSLNERVVYA